MRYNFDDGDIKSLLTHAIPIDMLSHIMNAREEYDGSFEIELKINGCDIDILPFLNKLYEAAKDSSIGYAKKILEEQSEEYQRKFKKVNENLDLLYKLTSKIPEMHDEVENALSRLWE